MRFGAASLPAESDLWQHLQHVSRVTAQQHLSVPCKVAMPLEPAVKVPASPAELLLALLAKTAAEIRRIRSTVNPTT